MFLSPITAPGGGVLYGRLENLYPFKENPFYGPFEGIRRYFAPRRTSTPARQSTAGEPRMFKAKAEESFAGNHERSFRQGSREAKLPLPAWALPPIRDEYRSEIEPDVPKPNPVG
jgi:hypothetical protein